MDEKDLDEAQVVGAIKEQILRSFQQGYEDVPIPDVNILAEKMSKGEQVSSEKAKLAASEAEKIVSSPWFKEVYSQDAELKKFNESYKALKG
ncbi:MAG TPA: hypothetical protein VJG83_06760 [archaeon]|nr:hypothetical protein [archaeon]